METNTIRDAILSFIIPGLGQALNGDTKRGMTLFAVAIFMHLFTYFIMNNRLGQILTFGYSLYAAYDVYRNYQ